MLFEQHYYADMIIMQHYYVEQHCYADLMLLNQFVLETHPCGT